MRHPVPSGTTSQANALVRLHKTAACGSEWVLGRNGRLSDLVPKLKAREEQIQEASKRFIDMPMLQID